MTLSSTYSSPPVSFTDSKWTSVRDTLSNCNEPQLRDLGKLMSRITDYARDLPLFIGTEARTFANRVVSILLDEDSLDTLGTLAECIQLVPGEYQLHLDIRIVHAGQCNADSASQAVLEAVYYLSAALIERHKMRLEPPSTHSEHSDDSQDSSSSHSLATDSPPPSPRSLTSQEHSRPKADLVQFLVQLGMERHGRTLADAGVSSFEDLTYVDSKEEMEELMATCGFTRIEKRKFGDKLNREGHPAAGFCSYVRK
eukprot:TRINITY_DN3808_c0_g1_i4.p1 TRINITY_DN3808_c0_g1~~TRINITY_DN3808_c0_g1_i4.p1  ORF type:complete len:255 (-),score=29.68 TRINITY_DN3808_c0_g1_i4:259-1023(-)